MSVCVCMFLGPPKSSVVKQLGQVAPQPVSARTLCGGFLRIVSEQKKVGRIATSVSLPEGGGRPLPDGRVAAGGRRDVHVERHVVVE